MKQYFRLQLRACKVCVDQGLRVPQRLPPLQGSISMGRGGSPLALPCAAAKFALMAIPLMIVCVLTCDAASTSTASASSSPCSAPQTADVAVAKHAWPSAATVEFNVADYAPGDNDDDADSGHRVHMVRQEAATTGGVDGADPVGADHDNSRHGRDHNHGEEEMEMEASRSLKLRIGGLFAVLVAGLVGCLAPIVLRERLERAPLLTGCLRALSAGLILCLALVHIASHAVEEMDGLLLVGGGDSHASAGQDDNHHHSRRANRLLLPLLTATPAATQSSSSSPDFNNRRLGRHHHYLHPQRALLGEDRGAHDAADGGGHGGHGHGFPIGMCTVVLGYLLMVMMEQLTHAVMEWYGSGGSGRTAAAVPVVKANVAMTTTMITKAAGVGNDDGKVVLRVLPTPSMPPAELPPHLLATAGDTDGERIKQQQLLPQSARAHALIEATNATAAPISVTSAIAGVVYDKIPLAAAAASASTPAASCRPPPCHHHHHAIQLATAALPSPRSSSSPSSSSAFSLSPSSPLPAIRTATTLEAFRLAGMAAMFELGCVLHSFLIGLMLGTTADYSEAAVLIIALSFHQLLEGVGLGVVLVNARLGRRRLLSMAVVYSVTCPAGIATGIGTLESYDSEAVAVRAVQGTLNGISAGLLLYLASALITADFGSAGLAARWRVWERLMVLGSLFVGAALLAVLGIWA